MNTIHLIQSNWEFLLSLLPNGWEKLARETKAVERLRGIPNIPVLMRLLFIHLGLGHSLRETVSEAELAGIAKISDVALLNRLRNCELFFHGLVMSLLSENGVQTNQELMNGLVVRVVDATNVKEHGKTGSIWRLHTVLRLPDLICDHFELTPNKGAGTGETLARIPIKKGECLMGDRAYGTAPGIAYIHNSGGYSLTRISSKMPLEDTNFTRITLTDYLRKLKNAGDAGEWQVNVRHDGRIIPGRLCAIRKDAADIIKAEKRLRARASKNGEKLQGETLEVARYVVIFTTVPNEILNCTKVLELYRSRWQIELLFKRFKSIAQFGHLPKYEDRSSRAWLYGKLLICLLTEKATVLAKSFSPWGPIIPKELFEKQMA